MTRVTRMFVLVAIGAFCLCTLHCSSGDSVRAVSVDNPDTAADLGISVGTTIELTCVGGGTTTLAHVSGCGCDHLHGAISVPALAATAADRPDPIFPGNCGHGCIISTSDPDVTC